MPHRCVRCGTIYEDGTTEIVQGCNCGSKLFFYVKKKDLEKSMDIVKNLSTDDKKQIEEDVCDIVGIEPGDDAVVLDMEAISVLEPGKFEIDIVNLLNNEKPLIYKLEEGKYIIDIAESFKRSDTSKSKDKKKKKR